MESEKEYHLLSQERDGLNAEIDELAHSLDEATATANAHRKYAEPEWYAGIKNSLRIKRRRMQEIVGELKELKRKSVRGQNVTFERIFMNVVRDIVSDKQYLEYIGITQQRFDQHVLEHGATSPDLIDFEG